MFTNYSHLLRDNPVRRHHGLAVTDVDGDGAFEVVVAGFGRPNMVLKWNGTGFVDIADRTIAGVAKDALATIAADLDGDGREELYLLNGHAPKEDRHARHQLLSFRDGKWIDLFSRPENQDALNATVACAAVGLDRLGCGRYGFFVANAIGPMRLYETDENGQLADVAPEVGLDRLSSARGLVALPLVTHQMDVFATTDDGANLLFCNRGDGTYKEVAEEAGLRDLYKHGRGVAVLDADGDSKFDIVYGNWEGAHRLFLQGATGQFRNVAPQEMARSSRVRSVVAADFDNDGIEEILFNNLGEPNRLFGLRNGAWRQLDIGDAWEPDSFGTGAVVGDFDGDGRLELLVAHGEAKPQPLTLYRPQPTEAGWLRVLPLTRYGAPARGAVCRLTVAGERHVRAIDAGSGYLCQMEPVAHFGLGPHRRVDRLEVCWPDGAKVSLDSPMANQLIRVPYPGSVLGKFEMG
ncbi:CRTAC1 family protein [Baaleninema sp.]|uniref:CRTAC1 family protein n=1 Tax=Baaleninema sp. TaxID=3101197 RepID=UPI003D08A299